MSGNPPKNLQCRPKLDHEEKFHVFLPVANLQEKVCTVHNEPYTIVFEHI